MIVGKFPLRVVDRQEVLMPDGAEVLCVQIQGGVPCIWAKMETSTRGVFRAFVMRGTGHQFTGNEGMYVGTFQLDDGAFVGHLFEEGGRP